MSSKVLIVDDVKDMREVLKELVASAGFAHAEAASGLEALEIIRADPMVALVLLDIDMPEMDGHEVLERISDLRLGRKLKVCFVTSKRAHGDVMAAIKQHADGYIVKPVKAADVIDRVKRMMG